MAGWIRRDQRQPIANLGGEKVHLEPGTASCDAELRKRVLAILDKSGVQLAAEYVFG